MSNDADLTITALFNLATLASWWPYVATFLGFFCFFLWLMILGYEILTPRRW